MQKQEIHARLFQLRPYFNQFAVGLFYTSLHNNFSERITKEWM